MFLYVRFWHIERLSRLEHVLATLLLLLFPGSYPSVINQSGRCLLGNVNEESKTSQLQGVFDLLIPICWVSGV